MQDKLYDVRYDTGDKVIQCGRHNDIFKLWLQWRAKVMYPFQQSLESSPQCPRCAACQESAHSSLIYFCSTQGDEGFERHMDKLMELAEYMVRRIKEQPDKFELMMEPELVNVSFWYVPTRLRSMPAGPEREQLCGQVSYCYRLHYAALH